MPEPTNLSDDELWSIAERALPFWGLKPDAMELVSRSENTVYRLDMADDKSYSLRIHRPGYHTLNELESELLWTQALNRAGISVPVGVRTLDGPGYATIPTPDDKSSRAVGLVEWIEGEILGPSLQGVTDEAEIVPHFEQLGRIAAALNNQAAAWEPPKGFARHAFDVPGYVGETPFWGRFWDLPPLEPAQRKILGRARDRIHDILTEYGKDRGTYSMIHADLHLNNILVDEDGSLHVIDFDDAGFGWHQYDFATALFGYDDQPYFDAIQEAMIRGYREERPFDKLAVSLLPLFLLIRRLVLIGWQWDRPELGRREGLEAYIEDACERVDTFSF